MSEKAFRSYYLKDPSTWKERLHSNHQKCTKPKLNHITGFAQDSPAAPQDSPVCALKAKTTHFPLLLLTCPVCFSTPPTPHLSSLRHWKWMEDRSNSTPVLSGSCLHSCMQWRSAASKSPDWYSRCASSANPWKESIRFVGSGAPT